MSQKELAHKMEELQIEAEKMHSLQEALFEAIYQGNNSYEAYEFAFLLLSELTYKVKSELQELTNVAFKNLERAAKVS